MNKKAFFLKAMKAGEFRRLAWVISAFSIINENAEQWKVRPYAYRISQTPAGNFFLDPDNENQLTLIEDAKVGEPIFGIKEIVTITKEDGIENFTEDKIETTYGRLLFNYVVLIYAFGNKVSYINSQITPSTIENLIVSRLKDNPEKDEERNNDDIYVDEYLKFCDSMFSLTGMSQLCVPAATEKTITAAPGIKQLREKLLRENADKLHDPTVIAKIDAELVAYDRAYIKGDLGEGGLLGSKPYNNVRKRLFSFYGGASGFEDSTSVNLVPHSLDEGWDVDTLPNLINSTRSGSFSRGAETQLGGEAFKWLQRASSNVSITVDDCGTKLGKELLVRDDNLRHVIGFHLIEGSGTKLVENEDEAKKYIGKHVIVRSPMYCKLDKTDYCKKCVGTRLASNPNGVAAAVANFGSTVLKLFLKKMHSNVLSLSRMNVTNTFK